MHFKIVFVKCNYRTLIPQMGNRNPMLAWVIGQNKVKTYDRNSTGTRRNMDGMKI